MYYDSGAIKINFNMSDSNTPMHRSSSPVLKIIVISQTSPNYKILFEIPN